MGAALVEMGVFHMHENITIPWCRRDSWELSETPGNLYQEREHVIEKNTMKENKRAASICCILQEVMPQLKRSSCNGIAA